MNKKITSLRLQKEEQSLQKQPLSQAMIVRTEYLLFHFCLYGLEEDFSGGFYHGVLELSEDYPFSPPKLKFYTQNGRFEVGKPICTTFTHYHKETWSSSWNIKTIITALISFMYSNEKGIGGIFYSPARRRSLAKKSLKENLGNDQFRQIFKKDILERGLITAEELQAMTKKSEAAIKLQQEKKDQTVCLAIKEDDFDLSHQKTDHPIMVGEEIGLKVSKKMKLEIGEMAMLEETEKGEKEDDQKGLIQPEKVIE